MKEIIGRTGNEWARDRLFARVAAASLGAVVGTIGVHFNLYVGLLENTFLRQAEFEVFDGKAAAEPLVFIIGVYAQDAAHGRVGLCIERMIEVGCVEKYGQTVRANDEVGVGEGVLIRGGINLENPNEKYLSKPICLGEALKIDYNRLNQVDLATSELIWIEDDGFDCTQKIKRGKRIGLESSNDVKQEDKDKLWRFFLQK